MANLGWRSLKVRHLMRFHVNFPTELFKGQLYKYKVYPQNGWISNDIMENACHTVETWPCAGFYSEWVIHQFQGEKTNTFHALQLARYHM